MLSVSVSTVSIHFRTVSRTGSKTVSTVPTRFLRSQAKAPPKLKVDAKPA